MPYKIKEFSHKKIESFYKQSIEELSKFYGFKMIRSRPRVIVLENRKIIDSLRGKKTKSWLIGWADGRNIFILDQSKIKTESCHKKYDNTQYKALLKHELSHSFLRAAVGPAYIPAWLNEGIAIYVSGQDKFKKPVNKFSKFLKSYDKADRDVYNEAGFAVELLVKIFGKRKLSLLIKEMKRSLNKSEFIKIFKKIYGFIPTYAKFNSLKL